MRVAFISLALAGLALAGCAQPGPLDSSGRGDPARLTYAPPGTRIALTNNANGQVTETRLTAGQATGPRGAFDREDGVAGGFYPGCWGCGGDMVIEEEKYLALWPLETGKETGFLRTAPDGEKARVVIRVAGTQVIETPAGQFDTYLLDGRIEHLTGPRYSAQVRAWWAPDPGWVVRAEGGDSQGSTLSSEVVEIIEP